MTDTHPRPILPMHAAGSLKSSAADGQLSLLHPTPAVTYPQLIPAPIAIGLGLFTAPVVVATAIRSVAVERSGLASGIDNTARQTGAALGDAIYGAIAARPTHPSHFIGVLRGLGIVTATGWVAIAGLTGATTRP